MAGASPPLFHRPASAPGRILRWYLPIPVAWMLFFAPQLLGARSFFWYDHLLTNLPYKTFYARAWKEGSFPLWSHELLCGYPLFASGEACAAYPPSFLMALLPEPLGYNWFVSLHILLAATGVFLLARSLGLHPAACLLGALTYGFSGALWGRLHHVTVITAAAWLPLVCLAAVSLARRPDSRRTGLFALALATAALGSHPQVFLYVAAAAVLAGISWSAGEVCSLRRGMRGVEWRLALFATAAVLAAGIAAVQLLPSLELVRETERAGTLPADYFLFGSLPPSQLISWLLPNFFGTPANDSYWGSPEIGMYAEFSHYVGLLPLFLALLAVACGRRRPVPLFGFLFALALLGALGEFFPPYGLLRFVPFFGRTRVPGRLIIPAVFAVSILAAEGLDALATGRVKISRRKKWALLGIWIALLLVAGTVAAWLRLGWFSAGFRSACLAGLEPAPEEAARLGRMLGGGLGSGWWHFVAAAAAGTAGGFLLLRRRPVSRRALLAAVAVAAADLGAFVLPLNPHVPRDVVTRPPETAAAILASPRRGRLFRWNMPSGWSRLPGEEWAPPYAPGWFRAADRYDRCTEYLDGNLSLLFGLDSLEAMTTLLPEDYKTFIGAADAKGARVRAPLFPGSPLLNHLGVRYILTAEPLESTGLGPVHRGPLRVYENPDCLPRAFLVNRWSLAATPGAIREQLLAPPDPLLPQVVLPGHEAEPPRPDNPPAFQPVAEIGYAPDRVDVRWQRGFDGLLVLLDMDFAGWRCRVSGRPADILRANGIFRAVRVGPEDGRAVFQYRPASVRAGLAVTLLSLAGVGALVIRRRAPAVPQGRAEDTGGRRWGPFAAALLIAGMALGLGMRARLWRDDVRRLRFQNHAAFVHNLVGVELARAGLLDEAEARWAHALGLDPQCESARANLEILKARSGGTAVPNAPPPPE